MIADLGFRIADWKTRKQKAAKARLSLLPSALCLLSSSIRNPKSAFRNLRDFVGDDQRGLCDSGDTLSGKDRVADHEKIWKRGSVCQRVQAEHV